MVYSEIRAKARENLRGNWAQAIGVALLANILGGGIVSMSSGGSSSTAATSEMGAAQNYPPEVYAIALGIVLAVLVYSLVCFIIGGTVQLGYGTYLLKQHDGKETRVGDLFSQFSRFGTGFVQKFLVGLFTALWALLFIIPGIIKSFSYAMTPFILADHPELTALQAITRSRQLMNGHKWELFVLALTFLGWNLLGLLTFGIGLLWVAPYQNAAYAAFYRKISAQTP